MSMFRATLWEEDGKAFQYTVRIEPMDKGDPWGGTIVWEHPDDTERPVLHSESGWGSSVPDDLRLYRPVAQEPRMEEMAPDRPATEEAEGMIERLLEWPTEQDIGEGQYSKAGSIMEKAATLIRSQADEIESTRNINQSLNISIYGVGGWKGRAERADADTKDVRAYWANDLNEAEAALQQAQAEIARLRLALERVANPPVDGDAPYKPMEWAGAALSDRGETDAANS